MSLYLYLLLFILLASLLFVFIPLLKKLLLHLHHNNEKVSTPAKIVYKTIEFTARESYYILIFELYTGKKKKFKVNNYEYSLYCKGDKGILTYSDDLLIQFKKKY